MASITVVSGPCEINFFNLSLCAQPTSECFQQPVNHCLSLIRHCVTTKVYIIPHPSYIHCNHGRTYFHPVCLLTAKDQRLYDGSYTLPRKKSPKRKRSVQPTPISSLHINIGSVCFLERLLCLNR